jgi:hypothetical protein
MTSVISTARHNKIVLQLSGLLWLRNATLDIAMLITAVLALVRTAVLLFAVSTDESTQLCGVLFYLLAFMTHHKNANHQLVFPLVVPFITHEFLIGKILKSV